MQDSATKTTQTQETPEPDSSSLESVDRMLIDSCCDWPQSGSKFYALWRGDWQGFYPSQSEADSGFTYMLAKQTNDLRQISRIFMASGLGWRLRTGRKKKHSNYVFDMVNDAMRDKAPIATIEIDPVAELERSNERRAAENAKWQKAWKDIQPQVTSAAPLANALDTVGFVDWSTVSDDASVDWLWYEFIPKGMLSLLAGMKGAGKSTLAYNFAAVVSNGGEWPDHKRECESKADVGNVIIWTSEETDVLIKSRLKLAGANLSRVRVINTFNPAFGKQESFDPSRHLPALSNAISHIGGCALLIIDPIMNVVNGKSNDAADVRKSLQPLKDLAELHNTAVIGITHFAKNSASRDPLDRILGSGAFAQFARMPLIAIKDYESGVRTFTRLPNNIAPEGGGYDYEIEVVVIGRDAKNRDAKSVRVKWLDAVEETDARVIMNDADGVEDFRKPHSKTEETKEWLKSTLADKNHHKVSELEAVAAKRGIKPKVLRNAKDKLIKELKANGLTVHHFKIEKDWYWQLVDGIPVISLPAHFIPLEKNERQIG